MGELTGGEIPGSKCIEDNRLEVGVVDEIVQLSHCREFVVRVRARARRRRRARLRGRRHFKQSIFQTF